MPTPGQAWIDRPVTQPPGLKVPVIGKRTLPFGNGDIDVVTGELPAAPLFNGQAVFGDPSKFVVGGLNGTPAAVDGWLGLTPGTTVYGAGTGRLWGIAGTFGDVSSAACSADLAALQALEGPIGVFAFPTGEKFSFTAFRHRDSCRIAPGECVGDPAGPQGSGSAWTLRYWAVVRDLDVS